jgi:hypothetical protein
MAMIGLGDPATNPSIYERDQSAPVAEVHTAGMGLPEDAVLVPKATNEPPTLMHPVTVSVPPCAGAGLTALFVHSVPFVEYQMLALVPGARVEELADG